MAIVTISRQVAARGDEVASLLAERLGYGFVSRKVLGEKIVSLGFSVEKMRRYDEIKQSFFASLARDRDEYLDYLRTAIFEFAQRGNCVFIGRGSFIILGGLPNLISVRLAADDSVRVSRLMSEFSWSEKQALQRISESDSNRKAFHKSFFNLDNDASENYHLILNTGLLSDDVSAELIKRVVQGTVSPEDETAGAKKIGERLEAQRLTNFLLMECKLPVNFLRAEFADGALLLFGVAESSGVAERTVALAKEKTSLQNVVSKISVVHDFKFYP